MFKLIFENVEDKNPITFQGDTALHLAAFNGDLEICKYIISKVEDKNQALNAKDCLNMTPIDNAGEHNWNHMNGGPYQQVLDFFKSVIESQQDQN